MRIGQVVRVYPEKKFGFIFAENLREDIFFHFSIVDQNNNPDYWEPGHEVEFEINEIERMDGGKLRATEVRTSLRPQSVKIEEHITPEFNHKHHPRARQRKPLWRDGGKNA